MINKQLLQKRFSKQARTYDQYAQVQKKMANHLFAILERQKWGNIGNILEIGCGTGFLTEKLCSHFPQSQITAVDLAPGMIEVAKERIRGRNVSFRDEDIEEMMLDETYDLIVSNATFQWLNHLENTIRRLYSSLKPLGVIHFSTFGHLTFHELHSFSKNVLFNISS